MSDRLGPLLTLANALLNLAPPNLSVLISRISGDEDYMEFTSIVTELLPEREKEILRETSPSAQIAAFTRFFQDRYFPLPEFMEYGEEEEYGSLLYGIPCLVQGIGWEAYEQIAEANDKGEVLLTSLIENPSTDNGDYIAILDACQKIVPEELVKQIPAGGLNTEEAERIFKGTPYAPIALYAQILHQQTGNFWLDTDEEWYGNSNPWDWCKESVNYLTRQWKLAESVWQRVNKLKLLIEKAPVEHFQKIIDLIRAKKGGDNAQKEPGDGAGGLPVGPA